jgi:hypothetical protein
MIYETFWNFMILAEETWSQDRDNVRKIKKGKFKQNSGHHINFPSIKRQKITSIYPNII